MIIILSIILVVVITILGLLMHDLNRATREMKYINNNQTNALITSSTNFLVINDLIKQSNESLIKLRDFKQNEIRKDRQIQQMLTNLTHDIKTPLTVSMGYVQLLLKDSDPKTQKDLERVNQNLATVNYYLHYLMDFNLIQERGVELQLSSVDISELLEQELFKYYDEFQRRQLTVIPEINKNIMMTTDSTLLQRVFQNLIGNILKYGKRTVRINLHAEDNRIKLSFENELESKIKDASQLMNRFYTGDESRSNQSTGIGLNIVLELITLIGGKMNLDITDDTFKVELTFKPKL